MDNTTNSTEEHAKALWEGILNTVRTVITDPVGFYRTMPKTGGFGDPLIFMVVLAAASGLIRAVAGLFHIGFVGSTIMALTSIIYFPIGAAIFGFVGAAIVFVIWKLMGSAESYETAYRCAAYASAVSPIIALINLIPYLGSLIGLGWGLHLMVTASVEVHKIKAKTAWLVFGIIAAILALSSISAQIRVHHMAKEMGAWSRGMPR